MAKKAVKRVAAQKRTPNSNNTPVKAEEQDKNKQGTKNDPADKDVTAGSNENVTVDQADNDKANVTADKSDQDEGSDEKKITDHSVDANESIADESVNISEAADQSVEDNTNNENNEKKNERAESPLNILIGEEEENLLNSADEQDTAESTEKTENDIKDEKNNKSDEGNNEESQNEGKEQTKTGTESGNAAETGAATASEDTDKSKDDQNKNKSSQQGRSLWVTNLLPSTRAQELKHLLSKYGKVIGAKVVQSSRHPRTRCYGYVTMESKAAADLCMKKLNNTELKGQIIRIAKVRPEHSLPLKAGTDIPDPTDKSKSSPTKKEDKSKDDKSNRSVSVDKKTGLGIERKKEDKTISKRDSKDRDRERTGSRSSSRKERVHLERAPDKYERKSDILTFDKIREEREKNRIRERERAAREEEKRRREIQRSREIERRQREESQRLEREREKIRIERERLEKQRQEILRLERERQKLEREKLEQERQELRRQQIRLEEARRPIKRPASSSTSSYRRESSGYPDDRKREARDDRHYEEGPPTSRFEVSTREPNRELEKDYKSHMSYTSADRHYGSSHLVHSSSNGNSSKFEPSNQYVNRDREMREPRRREPMGPAVGPPKVSSDTRFNDRPSDRSPVSYPGVRDERDRRPISEHHPKGDMRSSRDSRDHRYGEPVPNMKENSRYREGQWHADGPSPTQPFSGLGGPSNSSRDSWGKSDNWRPLEAGSNDRWVVNNSSRVIPGSSGMPGPMFSAGNSSGMTCPPPPEISSYSLDRFDNYKSMNNNRKY